MPSPEQWLQLVPIGFAAGLVGTFVGVGGGFAFVPILLLIYKLDYVSTAATSLFVVMFNVAVASVIQGRQRRVDWRMGLIASAGSIPAAVAGTLLVGKIGGGAYQTIIGVVLIAAATLLVLEKRMRGDSASEKFSQRRGIAREMTLPDGRKFQYRLNVPVLLAFSVFKGVFAGLTGIAGATLLSPYLILVMRVPVVIATATSQFTILFTSTSGTASNLARGAVRFDFAVPLVVGALAGTVLGARLAARVHGDVIKWALAAVLAAVAIRMFFLQ